LQIKIVIINTLCNGYEEKQNKIIFKLDKVNVLINGLVFFINKLTLIKMVIINRKSEISPYSIYEFKISLKAKEGESANK
jgi:hypothetical protein